MVLIAGCRDDSTGQSATTLTPATPKVSSTQLSVGDTVAGLHVPQLLQADGIASISFDELRGSTVVLEFWATWCAPCIAEIPHLNELADELSGRGNVRFISITGEGKAEMADFLARKPIHTWIGIDEKQSLQTAFGIDQIPVTIAINREGKVAAKFHPSELSLALLTRIENGELLETESVGNVVGVVRNATAPNQPLLQLELREATSGHYGSVASPHGSSTLLGHSAQHLVGSVFGLRPNRTVFAAELPDKKFDLVTQFPKLTDDNKLLVQSAVASVFNVKPRKEERNFEVFILNLPGDEEHILSPSVSTGGISIGDNRTGINVVNGSLSDILFTMEHKLGRPIIDETGLTERYDLIVSWDKDAAPEAIADAFASTTGLVLSAARRDIEIAVIENRDTAQ